MRCIIIGMFLALAGGALLFTEQMEEASIFLIAVGVSAALYGIVQRRQNESPAPEEDEYAAPASPSSAPPDKEAPAPEEAAAETHTIIPMPVELSQEELDKGCSKTYTIRGEKVSIDIPPGAHPGKKIMVKTSFGALDMLIVRKVEEQEAPIPSQEAPSPYQRGLRYLYAQDRGTGLKKATGCFIEAYEKGDLNAGYMLCHCYREGKGVPVKPAFVVQLAEYLVRRRYYPAYFHLAAAYREGRGVPMNQALSAEYAKKFEDLCSTPIEGVDELVRYDALIAYETQKEEPDLRTLERLARENYSISQLPSRYSILALSLLRDAHCSSGARAEINHLLEEGCQADDMGCYYLKGLLLCSDNSLLYAKDEHRGVEYLRVAAERLGTPAALQTYLRFISDESLVSIILERYRNACRWGISGIQGSDELHCLISLMQPGLLRTEKAPKNTPPRILLENKNSAPLQNAVMRICCIDKKLDLSLKLSPLEPGECTVICPEDHNLELGKRLYIEVHADGRFSRMYLRNVNVLQEFAGQHDLI